MVTFLVDWSWISYRSHFAHSGREVVKKGITYKTGMIEGTFNALSSIRSGYPDSVIYLCLDGVATKALATHSDYKAHREKSHSDVLSVDMRKLAKAFSYLPFVKVAYHPEMEADETIAFLVETLKGSDYVVIYSGDNDLRQLVDDESRVVCLKEMGSGGWFQFEDESAVRTNLGLDVGAIALFKAICGDSSDNISGIPRFEKSIGTALSNQFKDPDSLYSALRGSMVPGLAGTKKLSSLLAGEDVVRRNYAITKIEPLGIPEIRDSVGTYEYAVDFFTYYEAHDVLGGLEKML